MSLDVHKAVSLLTAVTSTQASADVDMRDYRNLTIWQTGTGTITSGVLTVEEAHYDPRTSVPYTGTWAAITTLDSTSVTGGQTQPYHAPSDRSYSFVRVRLTTAVGGGGALSVALTAN